MEQFVSLAGHVNHFTQLLYIIKLHQVNIKLIICKGFW